MTDRAAVHDWVERYLRAWETNDADDIGSLVTDDAVYKPTPHSAGWRGREEIVREWIGRKDDPGTWAFQWEVLAVDGDLGVVRGVTRYQQPPSYENLWLIWLNEDGRAREFVEYWMERAQEQSAG